MELVLWDSEGGKAIGVYSMTGGGKTNMLDVIREAVTVMDNAVLVNINGAGSGDERAWEPLSLLTAAGLQADNPELQQRISGALRWVRNLIGQRAETAADTGNSVFQPTRQDPAVVVIIDEIDETGKIDGASKILEFLASKQRKAAVCLILAGQRATATWTGGAGVGSTCPPWSPGCSPGTPKAGTRSAPRTRSPTSPNTPAARPGFFQIWSTRAKKILARGRSFYIGSIGEQQEHIISRRDPAARPVLAGAAEAAAPAPAVPRDRPGSGLRDRLAHVRELNEGHPLPARTGALPRGSGAPHSPGRAWRSRGSGAPVARLGAHLGLSCRARPGHLEDRRVPPPVCDARPRGGRAGQAPGAEPDGAWQRARSPSRSQSRGRNSTRTPRLPSSPRRRTTASSPASPENSGRSWSRSGRSPTGRT